MDRAERDAELVDLVQISVRDHFQQRKLVQQLEEPRTTLTAPGGSDHDEEFRARYLARVSDPTEATEGSANPGHIS